MRAIILAGGKGTRLRPYTTLIPKPLVPIGGELSILEIVIQQLKRSGFTHLTLAVNHLSELVKAYIGDGSKWDITIDFSLEDKPLNTIGPLTLIENLPDNFLVMNGDILCDLDYRKFYEDHLQRGCDVTVSACKRSVKIDFGVLGYNEANILDHFQEKPVYHFDVSMGIYCLNRCVIEKLTKGEPYGFDMLMLDSLKQQQQVWIREFSGFWLDIGRPEDYEYADEHYAEIKQKLGLAG